MIYWIEVVDTDFDNVSVDAVCEWPATSAKEGEDVENGAREQI